MMQGDEYEEMIDTKSNARYNTNSIIDAKLLKPGERDFNKMNDMLYYSDRLRLI